MKKDAGNAAVQGWEAVPWPGFWVRFAALRAAVFDGIRMELEIDGHHKSYEGAMAVRFPDYFTDEWSITLDCYVLGPMRHYEWVGRTPESALARAEASIRPWLDETRSRYREDFPDALNPPPESGLSGQEDKQ